jgi:hypothetical protein
MATNRARDAARQLKVDLKNSMRMSSRSKERNPPDTPGRSYIILIDEKKNHALKACFLTCTS